jgi:hypothetical protein
VKDSVGAAARIEEQREAVRVGSLWNARDRISLLGLAVGLIPFAVAFAVYLLVFLEMHPDSTGDEPHYLVTAESIAYDLDVDLTNDYASRDRVLRVVNVFPLGPDAFVYKESGELRPFRGVGLPAVLAPAVALGGLTGARLVMILIAALLADQLYRLLRDLRLRRRYRVLAWGAALFCLPVVVFTSQIYPELPGALLVVAALRVMVVGASRTAALALGSSAAAALVWLHVRYLPLSVSIVFGLAVAASLQGWSRGSQGRGLKGAVQAARAFVVRCAGVLVKRWRTVTVPVLIPYAIGIGLLAAAFEHWYGSPNLRTPYNAYGSPTVGTGHWDFWYQFALRDILDPIVGWIPFAPVHWLGFAALGCLVVWFGWPAAGCVAAAAAYELVIASAGPGSGFGMPARYPMIIVPLIAVPLAVAIQKVRVARVIFVPLLALSIVFAVAAIRDYRALYPAEIQRIFGMRSTASAFPVLNDFRWQESFTVAPGERPPQTGKLERSEVVARARRDKPGYLVYGPYSLLKAGAYQATFPLAANGVGSEEPVATIDVVSGPIVLAREEVTGRQLRPRRLSGIELPFATPGNALIETRVYYLGRGTLRMGPIQVQPIAAPTNPVRYRDWPLTFLWVGGTFLVGWLFVEVMRLSRKRATSNDGDSEHSAGPESPRP